MCASTSPLPPDPSGLAPDGSPVAVRLRLAPGDVPELIDGAVPPGSRILELGCGVGRITHPLLALDEQDGVTFTWHDVVHRGDGFDAAVTYEVGTHSWTQRSSAAVLEDDQLVAGAAAAGLVFDCWLDFAEWFQAPDVARANSHGYRP